MKLIPLNDRVLIKRLPSEEKTASGLYIPDTAKEKPAEGEVVAVGAGKVIANGKVQELDVKVGNRVFFRKYAGTDITVEGTEYIIMREDEILAVVG